MLTHASLQRLERDKVGAEKKRLYLRLALTALQTLEQTHAFRFYNVLIEASMLGALAPGTWCEEPFYSSGTKVFSQRTQLTSGLVGGPWLRSIKE